MKDRKGEKKAENEPELTFREAELKFAEEMPAFLRGNPSDPWELAKREFIYHYAADRFIEEGILEELPDQDEVKVVKKTAHEWHGVWAEAIGKLLDSIE